MAAVEVRGLEKVVIGLRNLGKRHKPLSQTVVSYNTDYAVKIHEDMTLYHPNGQAQFLATAARRTSSQVAQAVRDDVGDGKSMDEALMHAGQIVLDDSNTLVPVLSGQLRASGRVDVV